jgi:hypothetical protein
MKPVKIFELKGDDWMKGYSLQTASAVGGLFSSTSNFDPFEISGMMQCSLASSTASNLSITTTPTTLTHWHRSGASKILAHSPTKLYEVLDGTPWTTLDKTTEVTITGGVRGAIMYKGKYVYSLASSVRASTLSGSDIQILSGVASDGIWHPLVAAADKNLYQMDYSTINKITSVTGTAGNELQKVNLEEGMYARHAVNDGRYLAILADNNPTGDYNIMGGTTPPVPQNGKYRCQVLFWDLIKNQFDQIFEFSDSYLIGGAYLDGGIYIFGGDNLYVCNLSTAPKAIFSFRTGSTITEKPQNPFQITQAKHSIYWTGQSNGSVYAYGSLFPGMKKVFYQPFAAGYTPSALTYSGNNFYIGTSGSDNFLRVTSTGSTRNTGSVMTAPIVLPRAFKFSHIKMVMQRPLVFADSINAYMVSQEASKIITASNPKTFSQIGAKQSYVFKKTSAGSGLDVPYFEDFQLIVSSNKAVARVEVWGIPQDAQTQII